MEVPPGRVERIADGGPEAIRSILAELRAMKFNGVLKTSVFRGDTPSQGVLVLRRGDGVLAEHRSAVDVAGHEALPEILKDAASARAQLEVRTYDYGHSSISIDHLQRSYPEAAVEGIGDPDEVIEQAIAQEARERETYEKELEGRRNQEQTLVEREEELYRRKWELEQEYQRSAMRQRELDSLRAELQTVKEASGLILSRLEERRGSRDVEVESQKKVLAMESEKARAELEAQRRSLSERQAKLGGLEREFASKEATYRDRETSLDARAASLERERKQMNDLYANLQAEAEKISEARKVFDDRLGEAEHRERLLTGQDQAIREREQKLPDHVAAASQRAKALPERGTSLPPRESGLEAPPRAHGRGAVRQPHEDEGAGREAPTFGTTHPATAPGDRSRRRGAGQTGGCGKTSGSGDREAREGGGRGRGAYDRTVRRDRGRGRRPAVPTVRARGRVRGEERGDRTPRKRGRRRGAGARERIGVKRVVEGHLGGTGDRVPVGPTGHRGAQGGAREIGGLARTRDEEAREAVGRNLESGVPVEAGSPTSRGAGRGPRAGGRGAGGRAPGEGREPSASDRRSGRPRIGGREARGPRRGRWKTKAGGDCRPACRDGGTPRETRRGTGCPGGRAHRRAGGTVRPQDPGDETQGPRGPGGEGGRRDPAPQEGTRPDQGRPASAQLRRSKRLTAIVTLTTDFGAGEYIGAMKGAILTVNPEATVVDVDHSIRAHDIRHGAYVLYSAVPYYPFAAHVGVVDPGVGTKRRAIVCVCEGAFLVGPDNGLLVPAARRLGLKEVREITNRKLGRPELSDTFHGRDLFAPGDLLATLSSSGFLEISRREASAAGQLEATPGMPVSVAKADART